MKIRPLSFVFNLYPTPDLSPYFSIPPVSSSHSFPFLSSGFFPFLQYRLSFPITASFFYSALLFLTRNHRATIFIFLGEPGPGTMHIKLKKRRTHIIPLSLSPPSIITSTHPPAIIQHAIKNSDEFKSLI